MLSKFKTKDVQLKSEELEEKKRSTWLSSEGLRFELVLEEEAAEKVVEGAGGY